MQDQPTDSSDLTTDDAAALVPEGKAARRRHRMPRAKLRQAASTEAGADAEPAVEPDAEAAVEPDAEAAVEPVAEPAAEPVAEAVAEPAVEPVELPAEQVVKPVEPAEPESVDAPAEPEPTAPTEPEPEPATRRSRFPWRKAKADAPDPPAAAEIVESDSATNELDDDAPPAEPDDAAEPESEQPTVMVPHRPAGRRLKAAAVIAGAVLVAAAAFAGATLQPYLVDRAEVQTKLDVARTAQAAITTLWTYTPEDMDKLDERAAKYLGGAFAKDYQDYIGRIVEANKQAQISNSTQVLGAAVESLTPTQATAIIYTNSVATSPVTKGIPSLRYLSYRLQLEREHGAWLITTMTAVTSLDLTPRL